MRQREKIIYLVASVVVIALLIGGLTYAWIGFELTGNEESDSMRIVSAKDLTVINLDSGEFTPPSDLAPGWSQEINFTIENKHPRAGEYKIVFKDVINDFVNKEYLVYSISSTNGGALVDETPIPDKDGAITSKIALAPGVAHEYIITLKYLTGEPNVNLIDDLGKSFSFRIELE